MDTLKSLSLQGANPDRKQRHDDESVDPESLLKFAAKMCAYLKEPKHLLLIVIVHILSLLQS